MVLFARTAAQRKVYCLVSIGVSELLFGVFPICSAVVSLLMFTPIFVRKLLGPSVLLLVFIGHFLQVE